MLYDTNIVTHIRAKYNICGVLIGSLPQAPQQNVFQGIPLELMPEEARLLCEKGVAYVVDDVKAHKRGYLNGGMSVEERRKYQESLRKQGQSAAESVGKKAEERKKAGLSKRFGTENWNDIPEDMFTPSSSRPGSRAEGKRKKRGGRQTPADSSGAQTPAESEETNHGGMMNGGGGKEVDEEEMLFASAKSQPSQARGSSNGSAHPSFGPEPYAITPTTSYPPLISNPPEHSETDSASNDSTLDTPSALPEVPSSYPLYKHLHESSYFMTPGLRFGCQYTAYPGDPLRFHSHFLCSGMDWDQEFDLLDLVGGGRLGTGVKKGFLIGGEFKVHDEDGSRNDSRDGDDGGDGGRVRTFCIEWGGM